MNAGFAADRIYRAPDAESAVAWLHNEIRHDDLVLVKGSRAVGMDRIAAAISVSEVNQRDSNS
jgi:UDP-N-acetylmuramyl pentapeptide synthase